MPLRTRCGTSRLPCMSLGVRAQGLGPRGGGTALAITICSVLPSVPYDAVGPPKFILLSRLNIQPARLPVNASPLLSRTTTHDSGPIWFATPSLGGTCTRETYRFVPAHRLVKILERPAGQKFTCFQDRRRHRRSGSRMSILTSRAPEGVPAEIPSRHTVTTLAKAFSASSNLVTASAT